MAGHTLTHTTQLLTAQGQGLRGVRSAVSISTGSAASPREGPAKLMRGPEETLTNASAPQVQGQEDSLLLASQFFPH